MSRIGFESIAPLHPLPAEAYKTPLNTLRGQKILDVRIPGQAQEYLEAYRGDTLPVIKSFDDVLQALENEPRAALYLDGTPENVYEHIEQVVELGLEVAEVDPRLDKDEVKMDGEVHDADEALGMDTQINDPEAEATRFIRGAANATLLYKALPKTDPHLQAYLRYRWADITGNYTPSQNTIKTVDKVAAYKFQLRDNVRATLHRERQEDYTDLFRVVIPKVISNPHATVMAMSVFRELAPNWEKWGCKPIDGDPNTIISYFTYHALARHTAKVRDAYSPYLNTTLAKVKDFEGTEIEDVVPQKIILSPEAARQHGHNVILLSSRRGNGDLPPTPPNSAHSAISLSLVA